MKYIVTRTSSFGNKPCRKAFKAYHEKWHTRTCTEEYFNEHFSKNEGIWRENGKNHHITKEGYIKRQEEDQLLWTIEINTLEELNSFIKKYGEVVITENKCDSESMGIEIYDDYRE